MCNYLLIELPEDIMCNILVNVFHNSSKKFGTVSQQIVINISKSFNCKYLL